MISVSAHKLKMKDCSEANPKPGVVHSETERILLSGVGSAEGVGAAVASGFVVWCSSSAEGWEEDGYPACQTRSGLFSPACMAEIRP